MFDLTEANVSADIDKLKVSLQTKLTNFINAPAMARPQAYLDLIGQITDLNGKFGQRDLIKLFEYQKTL